MRLRRLLTPVFFVMLIVSFTLWYITKLSYTYTTELPVKVNIDGQRFVVKCVVEGKGTTLMAQRYYLRNAVNLRFAELNITPSPDSHGYRIEPYSLQNALSIRNSEVRIVSIGALPELTMPTVK